MKFMDMKSDEKKNVQPEQVCIEKQCLLEQFTRHWKDSITLPKKQPRSSQTPQCVTWT